MNWKKHAYLFTNGKFKIRHTTTNNYDFVAYFDRSKICYGNINKEDFPFPLSNCTLIARKIEDMTDEEIIESVPFKCLKDIANPTHIRMMEIDKNSFLRSGRMMLYMLSIGVYPFDQSHFGETVIDIKTINGVVK